MSSMSTTRGPVVLEVYDSASNPFVHQDDPMIDEENGSNEEFQTNKRQKAIDNEQPKVERKNTAQVWNEFRKRPDGSNVSSIEPALAPAIVNGKYDHMRMRESITHWILMHEHSFSIVEEAGFDFMMKCFQEWDIEKKIYSISKDNALMIIEARTKTFNDLAQQSTYEMLSSAYKFKEVFPKYEERDCDYESCHLKDDWVKVEQICGILEVFSNVTNIISGSDYPTSNLFLCEVYEVKQILDGKKDDENEFI
ncbi:zinc finger BED domain-containing protein RICESLEEPER 2-like protein [Tanacetum coccineum]